MARIKKFFKITGDLADDRPDMLDWLKTKTATGFSAICPGGGTRISAAFAKLNVAPNFGPIGREILTFELRQLARDELELAQQDMQDILFARGIHNVSVIIPVLDIASVLCHMNGDTMVEAAYLGYDELYVLTLQSRLEAKQKRFAHLPRVQVVAFPDVFNGQTQ